MLYIDLEESLGTHERVCAAYEKVLELKLITPQMLLNYATYLQEHKYYEDAFKVRGCMLHGPDLLFAGIK